MDAFMGETNCCHCLTPKGGILFTSLSEIIFFIFNLIWTANTISSGDYKPEKDLGISEDGWIYLTILLAIMATVNIITRPLLIIGVILNNTLLMLPSICVDIAQISVVGLGTCLVFLIPDYTWYEHFMMFLFGLLILFVMLHWFYVLFNYYKTPRRPNSERSAEATAYSSAASVHWE